MKLHNQEYGFQRYLGFLADQFCGISIEVFQMIGKYGQKSVFTTLNIKTYCFSISNDSEGKLKSLKSEA